MASEQSDLRTFVSSAIEDILGGIEDAKKADGTGQNVASTQIGGGHFPEDSGVKNAGRQILSSIKFDVAVTVAESDASKKGGRLSISVVHAEIGGEKAARSETISRVQFSVPIRFA